MWIVFRILVLSALLFAAMRGLLFWRYHEYFADTSLTTALLSGSRFDLKLVVAAMSPFLLILILPLPKRFSQTLRRFAAYACALILMILLSLAVADLAYFGEVNRHISSELAQLGGDVQEIVATAFSSRLGDTLFGVGLWILIWWVWRKWVMPIVNVSGSLKKQWFQAALSLVVLIFLARGMVVQGKPLSTVDAFNGKGQAQANLTLNGVLTALQSFNRKSEKPLIYMSEEENAHFSQRYPTPFVYHNQTPSERRNVVMILLESWSYRYIDALAQGKYGVTPNMDALVRQSQVWRQFYAAGQRSIIGMQAVLTSVPVLPDRNTIGWGLEMNNMSRLAQLAQKNGYRTLMAQSSNRRSFHMDGIAQAVGFEEYYGKEDVPLLRSYPQDTPTYGWDYDTLMFVGKKISEQPEKPFFAFVFTGTTHEPFARMGQEFERYPHDPKGEKGLLNTISYSDWAIGELMDYARTQAWYDNTIFVFTADHTFRVANASNKEQFHIPLVIFDPRGKAAIHDELASQYDLLPTLTQWLDIREPIATFGRNLLDKQSPVLPIMLNRGETIIALTPQGQATEFRQQHILSGSLNNDVRLIQWRMQKADELLQHNRWYENN